MKITIIDEPLSSSSKSGLGAAVDFAEQVNDVMYLCPSATLVEQCRQGFHGMMPEWQLKERKLYDNGKRFTDEGIHYENNPTGFGSHIVPCGKLYYTDALGQAIAWGDEIHFYTGSYLPYLSMLKNQIWSLVCTNKTFIFHEIPRDIVEPLFKDFISGKDVKEIKVEP